MSNNQATIEKLTAMRLTGMVRAFRTAIETAVAHQFSADELLAHLVDAEWEDRHNRRLARLIKGAKFRYTACIEEIDFALSRNLDRGALLRLSDCTWIARHQNIILTGPTGVGNYVKYSLM